MPPIVVVAATVLAIALLAGAVYAARRERVPVEGQADASASPWHRHVSPIFFLLVAAAGVLIGFVSLYVALDIAH